MYQQARYCSADFFREILIQIDHTAIFFYIFSTLAVVKATAIWKKMVTKEMKYPLIES